MKRAYERYRIIAIVPMVGEWEVCFGVDGEEAEVIADPVIAWALVQERRYDSDSNKLVGVELPTLEPMILVDDRGDGIGRFEPACDTSNYLGVRRKRGTGGD